MASAIIAAIEAVRPTIITEGGDHRNDHTSFTLHKYGHRQHHVICSKAKIGLGQMLRNLITSFRV